MRRRSIGRTGPVTGNAPRGRTPDPAREAAILDAAEELLKEVGYDRMTLDAVARRASASKATIYRRWNGKADMVAALIDRIADDHPVLVVSDSLRADLLAAFGLYCAAVTRKTELVRGLVAAMGADPHLRTLMSQRLADPHYDEVDRILAAAAARGELPFTPDAAPVLRAAKGLVWHRVLLAGEQLDDSFIAEAVDSVFLPLLRGSTIE
jgi:AcrR family transcriptional regulator